MISSERRNLTQPGDWWQAYSRAATADGLTLSAWVGLQCLAGIADADRAGLSERPGAHRPKAGKVEGEL